MKTKVTHIKQIKLGDTIKVVSGYQSLEGVVTGIGNPMMDPDPGVEFTDSYGVVRGFIPSMVLDGESWVDSVWVIGGE